jgi:hypothetical protein
MIHGSSSYLSLPSPSTMFLVPPFAPKFWKAEGSMGGLYVGVTNTALLRAKYGFYLIYFGKD